jgi:succinyl-diaminopimelate desuccinylase
MGNPIPLLEKLIEIDSSEKPGINKAMDYCEAWLKERGLSVNRLENGGYKMLVCEIGDGEETIVLNGHIDVIEGEDYQFDPYIKEGKMYGRGTVDMKAGVASMMETMVQLQDSNLSTKVMLQIVPDEETGGNYGTKFLTEEGYLGDFIICGEPTHMGIAIQSKGVLQLDFDIRGRPAHGSRPWEGVNAITNAYKLFEHILKLPFAEESSEMFDKPSINLAKIKAGTVYNKVPDKCEMSLDIRYLPNQTPEEILEQIKDVTKGEVNIHQCKGPVKTREDNPFVQVLAKSVINQTDLERANIFGQHGSNDGQYFTKYGGSAIEFGPVGYDWHGDKELVYVDSVKEYQQVLEDFVVTYGEKKEGN